MKKQDSIWRLVTNFIKILGEFSDTSNPHKRKSGFAKGTKDIFKKIFATLWGKQNSEVVTLRQKVLTCTNVF